MPKDGTLATIAWRGSYITNPACSSLPRQVNWGLKTSMESQLTCDPQEDLLEPWKGGAVDCHQVQHAAAEAIWKEDCLISWTLFFISSWIDNKIQGNEHCWKLTFCWGRYYKSIAKVSHFHFMNIWMIGQKVGNCCYSTTRSSSKIFRVGYE